MITEIESLISRLLEKAVAKATVTNRRGKLPVDTNWFRSNLLLHWTRHIPYINTNNPENFRVSIHDKELMEQLTEALGLALEEKNP